MASPAPQVTVAVATKDRAGLVRDLLASLREQTLPTDRFEVVVVDDGSTDETRSLLETEASRGDLDLKVIHHERSHGPASARNTAWRAGRGALVAFTDDDCRPTPAWLAAGLAASERDPNGIVQGRTEPDPGETHRMSPFTRTQVVRSAGPIFETCNIFYPRSMLESVDGFADDAFALPAGEDTDLAWRLLGRGATASYAPDALVHHAVLDTGPAAMIRAVRRWEEAIPVFARHPGLRRAHLHRGVFWSRRHEDLLRFLLAISVARRSRILALILARPYLVHLVGRRSGPLLSPYLLCVDLVELYSVVRGAIRNRVLVL